VNSTDDAVELLEAIAEAVIPMLSRLEGVTRIQGVGSYYLPRDKPPRDLDYLLVIDFPLTDKEKASLLGKSITGIQQQYSGKAHGKDVRSVVSIFLKDSEGFFFNGEQLCYWDTDTFGFTLEELREETDKTEKYRIGWEEAPVLWRRQE
jgi:hypothetical protein